VVSTLRITKAGARRKPFRLSPKPDRLTADTKDIKIGKQRSYRSRMLPTQRRRAILAELRQT